MKCRNCSAEIADKALICYRCGTATTEAKYQPVDLRASGRRRSRLLIIALIVALALLAALYVFRSTGHASPLQGSRRACWPDLALVLLDPSAMR